MSITSSASVVDAWFPASRAQDPIGVRDDLGRGVEAGPGRPLLHRWESRVSDDLPGAAVGVGAEVDQDGALVPRPSEFGKMPRLGLHGEDADRGAPAVRPGPQTGTLKVTVRVFVPWLM